MLVSSVHPWCDRPDDAQSWRGSPYNRGWMIRNPVRDVTRIISQTSEQLILERRPNDVAKTNRRTIFLWFCCSTFLWMPIAGWMCFAYHFCFPDPETVRPIPADMLIFFTVPTVLNILAFGTALYSLVKAKVSTFIFDKVAGELTIIIRSMWHEEIVTYALPECQGAIVESQAVIPKGAPRYMYYNCWIMLDLSTEQSLRLTAIKRLPQVPIERTLADTINQFLRS
jgi:hypothetical protein